MSKPNIGWRKAGIASLATTALVCTSVFTAGAASAVPGFEFERVAGQTRYDTSAETAQRFGNANTVILASGESGRFADALAANFLAGDRNAPVILTQGDSTPTSVRNAIEASGADNVIIVGGELAVSAAQEAALRADYTVERISGRTRFDTAAAIIAEGDGAGTSNVALIASGTGFADALAAGPLAFAGNHPLGLVNADSAPQEVIDALLAADVDEAIIVGGLNAVSDAVKDQLEAAGITVIERFEGGNRADTSRLVAEYAVQNMGFTNESVNVASGRPQGEGADALGAGALSGQTQTPLLITAGEGVAGPDLLAYLEDNAATLEDGLLFGGPLAVPANVEAQMEAAAGAEGEEPPPASNADYAVTPAEAATLPFSLAADDPSTAADERTQGVRRYTVSGLDDTRTYQIQLFDAANVIRTGQVVSFADAETNADGTTGNNVADRGTVDARITSVNNSTPGVGTETTTATPVNGTIVFTVNSAQADAVTPVVFFNGAGGTAGLDLAADNTPTEEFGVGGTTTWTAPAATSEASATGTVTAVDKDANTVTFGVGPAARTYSYDANDTFALSGATPPARTLEQFEAALNRGDTVTVAPYYANSALSSQWTLTDSSPRVTGAAVAGSGASSNDVTVTVTPTAPSTAATYSSFIIQRAQGAAPAPGDFATIATITAADDADRNAAGIQYVDENLPAGQYTYRVAGIVDGDQSPWAAAGTVNSVTPGPDTTRPTAVDTRFSTTGGLAGQLDQGDVFKVVFDETMAAPAAGATLQVRDTDGTIANLVNGTNATFALNTAAETVGDVSRQAGRVLTVTLTGAPTILQAGGTVGVQNPADIVDSSGIADLAGNRFNVSTGDVTIDVEPVDQTPPVVTAPAAAPVAGATTVTFTANEALNPATVQTGDFTVTGGATQPAVTGVAVSPDGRTITVTTGALVTGNVVTLAANSVADTTGNTGPTAPVSTVAV
ncbi:cell wall-binding repeat-containing protein [Nocardioides massiliensis]|uniref:Cell wall-binding protein n=1 Tax=Nocardioides massiliensis TaxID=1325935 RepID=A0ABT9NMH0_9ACTN|nr:cell wall-binding repeat-containing protein [Nocardioides massiliensis]MDP9821619.1 putative cell wall-binding protein [Nocardioides massiliensis]